MEQEYLDEFNSIFGTKLEERKKDYTMLLQIFHDYIEQSFRTTELHNKILTKIVDIEDELQDNLTDQGKELFKKWETYRDELQNYETEESFIFGYYLDKQLNIEKNKYIQQVSMMNKSKELLKHFDNIFRTETEKHINFNDMKLLKVLYDYFEEDIFTPNDEYKNVRHKKVELSNELRGTLTKEQQDIYDRQNELGNELHGIEIEQIFMFGYIIAKELDIECKK